MKFKLFGVTDAGRVRDHNEDNFAACKDLSADEWNFDASEVRSLSRRGAILIVADGMGGENAGEIASNLAQKSVKEQFQNLKKVPGKDERIIALLNNFILKAHDDIVEYQKSNLDTAGMGTTLVIAWILNDKLYTCWSGDSRCYVFNPQTPLYPFTDDHSHVWQQVTNQQISAEEARLHPESNLITQHLGDPEERPEPEGKCMKLQAGDRVLVCSDGLNSMISDAQIHYLLLQQPDTAEACKQLVEESKKAGGADNITVLLLDVDPVATAPDSRVARTIKSFAKPTNAVGTLTTYLIPVLLVLLFISAYHFFFNNTPFNRTRNITLGTKVINLSGESDIILNGQASFLPAGPSIVKAELTSTPKFGVAVLNGSQLLYKVSFAAAFIDTINLKMQSEDDIIFTAAYILHWTPDAGDSERNYEEVKPKPGSNHFIEKPGNDKNEEFSPPASIKDTIPDSVTDHKEIGLKPAWQLQYK